MKATRKIIGGLIVGCVLACCLSRFTLQTFAIEGLKVSVKSSNAVLSWPSATNKTYIAQYRPALTSSWVTLTNYFPAATNAAMTFFSNSIASNPNRAGFYRVVRDGAHIYGLTNNSTLSGEVQMPIEIAVDSTDQIQGVTFYNSADDSPVIGASAYTNSAGGWVFDWNTVMVENGSNNIYAEVDFTTDDPVSSANLPVSLNVNNAISFPNYFTRVFGSQMWVYAETIPSASYQVDMYDEGTNYLGSFSGSADGGGVISFLWDLTDGGGNTFDSTNFYGVFTVTTSSAQVLAGVSAKNSGMSANAPAFQKLVPKTFIKNGGIQPAASGSSFSANQLWVKEGSWTPNNNWVIAYASLTGDSTVDQRATDMILGGPGEDTDWGGVLGTLDEYGLNGNLSPGNNGQAGTVFTLNDRASGTNLLNYLADHRYENFYYFGHGNSSVISAYNASQTALTRDQIAFALVNVPLSYQMQHAAEHPYRFVFIDACNTGKGDFCEAFGIPAISVSTNYFASAGVESRAFVGFTKPTSFDTSLSSGDPNGVPNRSEMMATFLDEWLSSAIDLNHIVGGAENSFGQYGYKMDSSVVIYGATDLERNTRTRP